MSQIAASRSKRHFLRQALLVGFAVFLSTLLGGGRFWAGQLDSSISAAHQKAISSLAAAVSGRTDRVDQMLRNIGYTPPNGAAWRSFPAIRKLETAYLAAENAAPQQGGERMLALLSSDLAKQYESVRYDPALRWLLTAMPPPSVQFRNPVPVPEPSAWTPPPRVAAAVDSLSRYSAGNALGGTHGVVRDYLGLPPDKTYEILRTSASDAEAFKRAVNWVPESQRWPRLNRLVAILDHTYESAPSDRALDVFRADLPQVANARDRVVSSEIRFDPARHQVVPPATSPTPPDAPRPSVATAPFAPGPSSLPASFVPPPISHVPESPHLPERAPVFEAESRYTEFVAENYAEAASRAFGAMIGAAEGFGGVVFGNKVSADPRLPAPARLTFIPAEDASTFGRLEVDLQDGSVRDFAPVRLEDVNAAYHIVYSGTPLRGNTVLPAAKPGEGIGLVGLTDRLDYFDLGTDSIANDGVRWRVVIHPAIANMDLGWAATMSDSLPIMGSKLLALIEKNADADSVAQMKGLLAHTPRTWKITEVPLLVKADGTRLYVEKALEPGKDEPLELRQTAFLGIQGFTFDSTGEATSTPEFSDKFYLLEPVLLRASYDYDRLNQFAAVLAVCRWAKATGAAFVGEPPATPKVPTPASLIITETGFATAPDYTPEEARRELLERVEQKSSALTQSAGPQARATYARLQRDIDRAAAAFRETRQQIRVLGKERDQLGDQIAELLKPRPLVRQRYGELQAQLENQLALYSAAESGSKERKLALEQVQGIRSELANLLRAALPETWGKIDKLHKEIDELNETATQARRQWHSSIDEEYLKDSLVKTASQQLTTQYNDLKAQLGRQYNLIDQDRQKLQLYRQKVSDLDRKLETVIQGGSPAASARYDSLLQVVNQQYDLYRSARTESQAESARRRLQEVEQELEALYRASAPDLASERDALEDQIDALKHAILEATKQADSLHANQDVLFAQAFPQFKYWRELLRRAIAL